MDSLIILDEDKAWARQRIAELEAAILALGPEFNAAFTQTSETWHDNAPFEAVRDKQSVFDAERQQLAGLLKRSLTSVPKQKRGVVGVGSIVKLRTPKGEAKRFKIAGDWTPHAGKTIDDVLVVSRIAPITQELLGKKLESVTKFGNIEAIDYL